MLSNTGAAILLGGDVWANNIAIEVKGNVESDGNGGAILIGNHVSS